MSDTSLTQRWTEAYITLREYIERLERENAELRHDKERLDWCDKNLSGLILLGTSIREYVDAARKTES